MIFCFTVLQLFIWFSKSFMEYLFYIGGGDGGCGRRGVRGGSECGGGGGAKVGEDFWRESGDFAIGRVWAWYRLWAGLND
ncbi:Hypothetical predicted protein [Olea europaea subsp. europaea]|uniref:Uncharacterized protein n=1 Tax=Olea europaea subsp. europaea TaxID=158383 RepID=A0A8S0SW43_OLEEU|nr:Hypothetical predicted protein [Olea europaea subsp. europaea]